MPQSPPVDDSFPPPGLVCAPLTNDSPLFHDCDEAYQQIISKLPEVTCGFKPHKHQYDFKTVRSCTVHTYSQTGNAHCVRHVALLTGIDNILHSCSNNGYTQGSYTWTREGEPREGVKLIRSTFGP